jgi:hypothetical protein
MEFFNRADFLTSLEENQLVNYFRIYDNGNTNKSIDLTPQTKGILYWKHFIILTLVFLGLEILFIRIIK